MPCADCSTDDDRGCSCGPGEICGACFEGRFEAGRIIVLPDPENEDSKPLFAPGAEAYYRKVLKLDEPEDMPKILKVVSEPEPSPSSGVCKCGHPHGDHVTGCETCHANGVTLLAHHPFIPEEPASRPGDAPQVLHKWKGCEQCRHREHASFCPICRCLAVTSMEEIKRTCQEAGGCPEHPVQEAEEPPLTPEEEEEAPCAHESWDVTSEWGEKDAEGELTGKWCKTRRCNDCGGELDNVLEDEPHWDFQPADDQEPPPQPERRPPYAVTYSVSGHLFEVALSGDATVRAVDGALVIQHHLGPVAGIVSVLPVINKES